MFRQRWVWWAMGVALVVLVGAGALGLLSPRELITRAISDKIQKGMTERQMVAIVGRPPDRRMPFGLWHGEIDPKLDWPTSREVGALLAWNGPAGCSIRAFLDADGFVLDCHWSAPDRPGLLDRLRARLGW